MLDWLKPAPDCDAPLDDEPPTPSWLKSKREQWAENNVDNLIVALAMSRWSAAKIHRRLLEAGINISYDTVLRKLYDLGWHGRRG